MQTKNCTARFESRKVTYEKHNRLAAANNQPAQTDARSTNDLDYATGHRQRKEESTLLAQFALAGYAVQKGSDEDYTVCKLKEAYHCQDIGELHVLATYLGVFHEKI